MPAGHSGRFHYVIPEALSIKEATRIEAEEKHLLTIGIIPERLKESLEGAEVTQMLSLREATAKMVEQCENAVCSEQVQMMEVIADILGDPDLDKINSDMIDKLKRTLRKRRGLGKARVNRYLATLRTLLRRAFVYWELIPRVPPVDMYNEEQEQAAKPKRYRTITDEEYGIIRAEFIRTGNQQMADRTLFIWETGCRVAEPSSLTWEHHVDFANNRLTLITKGRKERVITMTPNVRHMLTRRYEEGYDVPFSSQGNSATRALDRLINRLVRQDYKKYGKMQDISFHCFRHTLTVKLTMAGIHPQKIISWIGWSDPKMYYKRYGKLAPEAMDDVAGCIASGTGDTK
jgi:integrase